ncbi:MAG: DUF998 domain-containing protein [Candidatus Nezhaarchaeota archaeon]|nr:DUF998 domain-containing protein [Candidatus Nezhaarchaeota archaeon]
MAAAAAWVTIFISAYRNPWFDALKHALSDLGGPGATDPWIYNYGLVLTGAVVLVYAFYLAHRSSTKPMTYSSAFIFMAGLFLALIGVFPSGTRPHTFVSTWFFVQMWMAMASTTIDLVLRGALAHGLALLALSILGPAGALLVEWPSAALLEVYGVALIDVYVVILALKY